MVRGLRVQVFLIKKVRWSLNASTFLVSESFRSVKNLHCLILGFLFFFFFLFSLFRVISSLPFFIFWLLTPSPSHRSVLGGCLRQHSSLKALFTSCSRGSCVNSALSSLLKSGSSLHSCLCSPLVRPSNIARFLHHH